MSKRSSLPHWITATGLALILLAGLSNVIDLTSGGIGRARIFCAALGVILLAVGIFKRKFFSVYQTITVLIANTIVLLLVMEFGAMCWHKVNPPQVPKTEVVSSSQLELYVGYSGSPIQSELVNVGQDGRRVTISDPQTEPAPASEEADPPIRIFAFGGSTMWGEGAADDQTIASHLQTLLRRKTKHPIEVINFGQRGWISTQNLIRLTLELRAGNIPDVVVFYDGYNDTTTAARIGKAGVPENLDVLVGDFDRKSAMVRMARNTALGRLVLPLPSRNHPDSDTELLATEVIEAWVQIHRMVEGLGNQYGFEVHFYLQPQLTTGNKPLTDVEQKMRDSHPWLPPVVCETATIGYEKARQYTQSIEGLTDLSDAFDLSLIHI